MQPINDLNFINIVEELIKFCFSFICHQDQSILFNFGEKYLPLCPRCLGLHVGFFGFFIISTFVIRNKFVLKNKKSIIFLFLVIGIAGFHWIAGYLGLLEMNSSVRFITGLISGTGVYFLIRLYNHASPSVNKKSEIKNYFDFKNLLTAALISTAVLYIIISNYHFLLITIFIVVLFNIYVILKATINSFLNILRQKSSTINYEVLK